MPWGLLILFTATSSEQPVTHIPCRRAVPLRPSHVWHVWSIYPLSCLLSLVVSLQRLAAKLTWRLPIGLGRGRDPWQVDDYLPVGNLFCSQHRIRNNPSEFKVQKTSLFRVEMELGTNCCFNLFFLACFGNSPAPAAFILRCGSAVFKDGLCLFDDLFSPKVFISMDASSFAASSYNVFQSVFSASRGDTTEISQFWGKHERISFRWGATKFRWLKMFLLYCCSGVQPIRRFVREILSHVGVPGSPGRTGGAALTSLANPSGLWFRGTAFLFRFSLFCWGRTYLNSQEVIWTATTVAELEIDALVPSVERSQQTGQQRKPKTTTERYQSEEFRIKEQSGRACKRSW